MRHSDLPSPPSFSLFPPLPLPSLFLSLLRLAFFLSPSFEISSSRAVASRGTEVYRRNFIPTRVSLRSPELMGSWKNLGRTLLASRTTLYLAVLTRTSYMLLTLSTRVRTSVSLLKYSLRKEITVVQMLIQKRPQEKSKKFKTKFLKTSFE